MSYRPAAHTSRREIDVAIGILVGLRGCSERAAFDELVGIVRSTGIGIGAIATGLAALASGGSSAGHDAAFATWGDLVSRRRAPCAGSGAQPDVAVAGVNRRTAPT